MLENTQRTCVQAALQKKHWGGDTVMLSDNKIKQTHPKEIKSVGNQLKIER